MQTDDSYLDRSADLVAKVRKLREQAEKEMDKFTCVADYDVRRVVGQKPKTTPTQAEPSSSWSAAGRARKKAARSSPDQTAIEFSPAPLEHGEDEEDE